MSKQSLHPAVRIKLLRESLQLSQRELAQEFNVSPGAVAQWEMGTNPVPGVVIRLMEIYEQHPASMDDEHQRFKSELKKSLAAISNSDLVFDKLEQDIKPFFRDLMSINQIQAKMKYGIANKMLKFLSGSKGLTIKAAQLASYMEIGLPNEIRLSLGSLQARMKPMSRSTVKKVLETTYHNPLEEIFSYFDFTPRAVTSLGQVHFAKLKDETDVAVKIQAPAIEETLKKQFGKLSFIKYVGGVINEDISIILDEIQKSVLSECNYLNEARLQEKASHFVSKKPRTIIPKVFPEFSRKNILVTEFFDAENFHSFCAKASQDSKNVVAETLVRTLTHLAFVKGFVMADIHPENFLVKNDKVIFLDYGRVYLPTKEEMKREACFYQAVILNDKEKARALSKAMKFAKDEANFNFDEFWIFLRNSSEHLLVDKTFKFTPEYLNKINREGRRYAGKKELHLSPNMFWGFTFSAGTWGLFAELEAECNWRQVALETFEEALL